MLEERKSVNMRDRVKAAYKHSKMEMIRNNGKVINKIIEVKRKTRRVIKRKLLDASTIKNNKKQKTREKYYEQSMVNNETMMNAYDLNPRK